MCLCVYVTTSTYAYKHSYLHIIMHVTLLTFMSIMFEIVEIIGLSRELEIKAR